MKHKPEPITEHKTSYWTCANTVCHRQHGSEAIAKRCCEVAERAVKSNSYGDRYNELIYQLIYVKKMKRSEIAKLLGCTGSNVSRREWLAHRFRIRIEYGHIPKPDWINMALTLHDLKSQKESYVKGRGKVFIVISPVDCERSLEGFIKAVGKIIRINGRVYKIEGVEMFANLTPLSKGDQMAISVGNPVW